ncbi:MAG TPA: hypothetical protein DHW02_19815 [Ktedonobacter sp.]|nr:hypothetical protein [Ktedonobacter sp.]
MNLTKFHAKRLTWLLAPSLLFMALIAGAFGLASTHAASPLDGSYNFRAATTSGPAAGTYITGQLALTVEGNNVIDGQICGLNIDHSHCVNVKGSTSDGIHVSLTMNFHVDGLPSIIATGAYYSHPGGHATPAFFGTYTFGSSTGSWEARTGNVATFTGSWNFKAVVASGTHKGTQYHGVLTLQQGANNGVSGTYCVSVGNCVPVLSGLNKNNVLIFYINMGGTEFRLQGTAFDSHNGRIGGQFRPGDDNSATADKGFWFGNTVVA